MTTDIASDPSRVGECPHRSYNWALPAERIDPYPSFAQARQETPIFWSDEMQCYVLTRYGDVVEAVKNTEAFSSRDVLYSGEVPAEVRERLPDGYPYEPSSLVNGEGAHHSRIRKIVLSVLSPRRVESLKPLVMEVVEGLMADLPKSGTFDLCAALAVPLPLTVIARILGLPDADAARLKTWSDEFSILVGNPLINDAQRLHAAEELAGAREYLLAQIASRRAERRSDLMSALVWAGADDPEGPLNDTELVSVCTQLMEAGNETVTILIGNLVYQLLSHPDQWRAVCSEESLRGPVVEETLRRMGAVTGMLRITTREVEIGGVRLEAGKRVVLMYAAANHDPEMFPEPDRFSADRPRGNRHLAFGLGEHLCVGAPLARLEVRCVLDALCQLGDRLRLAGEPKWVPVPTLHGFSELPVKLAHAE